MGKNEENRKERVFLVGVSLPKDDISIESSILELEELANAANVEVIGSSIQNRTNIDNSTYIGKGKAYELKNLAEELNIDTMIFNNELSGGQIRNLEKIIDRKIIDRTNLILDIFANRSSSKEGKLQVELAQLQYRLPRLIGYGNYLSRQGGGIGTRGPGEQKLEVDRRHILKRINDIKLQLEKISKTRETKRSRRINSGLPIVALVGYTNAGKSTLLNTLIKRSTDYEEHKEVFKKDMLFATLDTSFRKASFNNGREFLLIDTVGFVSQLPTKLIEAFKGTLEEIKYADVILHILDITNKDLKIQMDITLEILKDLDLGDIPIINVLNKADKVALDYIPEYRISNPKIMISAETGYNIDELLDLIKDNLPKKYSKFKLLFPYEKSNLISNLFEENLIISDEYTEDGIMVEAMLNKALEGKFKEYIIRDIYEDDDIEL